MIVDNRSLWTLLKTRSVTVSVTPAPKKPCAVFRVLNLIDLGQGRQTAVLDNVSFAYTLDTSIPRGELAMPLKIGTLDCVYTSKNVSCVSDVYKTISEIHARARVERIVPDVLAPGDFLVFKKLPYRDKLTLVEALRVMTDKTYRKYGGRHAL